MEIRIGKNGARYEITDAWLERDYTVRVLLRNVAVPGGYGFSLYDGRGLEKEGTGHWHLDQETLEKYRALADTQGQRVVRPRRPRKRRPRKGPKPDPRQLDLL